MPKLLSATKVTAPKEFDAPIETSTNYTHHGSTAEVAPKGDVVPKTEVLARASDVIPMLGADRSK